VATHPDSHSLERRARVRRRAWWLLGAALLATLLSWAVIDVAAASPQRAEAQVPRGSTTVNVVP
jgi:FtsH-binding integral membrane protein